MKLVFEDDLNESLKIYLYKTRAKSQGMNKIYI